MSHQPIRLNIFSWDYNRSRPVDKVQPGFLFSKSDVMQVPILVVLSLAGFSFLITFLASEDLDTKDDALCSFGICVGSMILLMPCF